MSAEADPLVWLQAQPGWDAEPARAAVLAGLARRAAASQGALRAELLRRLAQRLGRGPVGAESQPASANAAGPLAALQAALGPAPAELHSLRLHRRSFARLRLARRVAELQPTLDSASPLGPLHTQAVLPQVLRVLQTEAPDYLQHLLAQRDALALLAPTSAPVRRKTAAPRR